MAEPAGGHPRGDQRHQRSALRVNALGVLLALVFLAVAAIGLTGGAWWTWTAPGPWIIVALAALVGVLLVVTAGGSRRRPGG